MAILNSLTSSSLGLKGTTPDKVKFNSISSTGTPLGLEGETPESINFKGPNVNSNLGFTGETPNKVNLGDLKNSFEGSPLSLNGKIPSYNYNDNLPEQGIKI